MRKHSKLGKKVKLTMTHNEKLIRTLSKQLGEVQEQLEAATSKVDTQVKREIDPNGKQLVLMLKASVGKLLRIFFYPTNRATSATKERMKEGGVDHKCEFAVALQKETNARWPEDNDVEWMKKENWNKLWEGKYCVTVGMDSKCWEGWALMTLMKLVFNVSLK